jgi:hypothetical protein
VLVEKIDVAIQIPIEAVIERSGQFFCAIPQPDGSLETRKLDIGLANETDLVVLAGLDVSDQVVLNIRDEEVMELLTLPKEES